MRGRFLFVYGTLRRGTDSKMHHFLARHADFIGNATYQGKLYKIGEYPGAVPAGDPSDLVQGEVYRLRDPDSVLARLDRYEGCGPGFAEPAEYIRKIRPVRLSSGEAIQAWVYLYNRTTDNLERVPAGDFFDIRTR
jgi:gamma-glutamylcyclotransferase (GGCT)/AIG2-like uncharacterized protein YtfP